MLSRSRRRVSGVDYWPGFVDALSTLLLVVTFLMVLFMVAQYFVAQEAAGKDTALARLQKQIAQIRAEGNVFLNRSFPKLDYILRATVVR